MAPASEQDEDFRRFVEAHWLGLVRSAYLLVGGDRGYAEALVQRTLAGVFAHWHRRVRDGAPVAYVHDSLVNRAVSEQRRSAVRETLFGWMGDEPPTPERAFDTSDASYESVAPPDVVVQALGELPPRMRAAVVLRHVDEATEAVTADVLGRSVGAVRRDASRGLQRVHTAMATGSLARAGERSQAVVAGEHANPYAGPGRGGGVEDPAAGNDVRRALLVATEHLSVPSDAYARVMESVASTRHRRSTIAAGCIATVVLAAVVALAAGAVQDGSRIITPAPDAIFERPSTTDADLGRELDWPVRGELGTDPAFAAEFERVLGADHRLLYAEDSDAGKVVVAVSARGDTVVLHGPSDVSVENLERFSGLSPASQDITVAVPVGDAHVVIAVMPESVGYAQLSVPSVGRDGSVYRNWRQMPVERGVARMVTDDPVGTVRVRTPVGDGAVHVVAGPLREPGTLICGPCDDAWVVRQGPSQFRDEAADAVGAAAADVTSRLLLDATVPAVGGRIVGYVAEVPTGGLLRATYLIADLGNGDSTLWMVEPLRPLPVFDPARPFVFTAQPSGDLVIVAPGASRISFSPIGDAPALPDVRLTDSVGLVTELPPDVASYRIFAYAPNGSLSGGWHGSVLQVDDPLQVRYRLGSGAAG